MFSLFDRTRRVNSCDHLDLRAWSNMERWRYEKWSWWWTENQYSSRESQSIQRWEREDHSVFGLLRCHLYADTGNFTRQIRIIQTCTNCLRCGRFLLAWSKTSSNLRLVRVSMIDRFVLVRLSIGRKQWKTFFEFRRFYWLCFGYLRDDIQ